MALHIQTFAVDMSGTVIVESITLEQWRDRMETAQVATAIVADRECTFCRDSIAIGVLCAPCLLARNNEDYETLARRRYARR